MKKLFLLLAITCALLSPSCAQTSSSNTPKEGIDVMKNIYYLNYDLSGDFEIIVDGISLKRNTKSGLTMNYEYLNPYIQKSGLQNISLKIKSFDKDKMSTEILKKIKLEVYVAIENVESNLNRIQTFTLPEYKEAQDSIFCTWTFEADVPFEIHTLNDAQDLTNEDPQKLLEEVLLQYQHVHNLINEGKVDDYMRLYKKSREREMISMYYDENKQKEYLQGIEQRTQSSIGYMQSLADYKLLLHPNGKIVSLMNNDGKTPLYSIDDQGKIKTYGLQLYRSLETGQLEVY